MYLDEWLDEWLVESINDFQSLEEAREFGGSLSVDEIVSDNPVVEVDFKIEEVA
jgi:hypothetical protein